MSDEIKTRREIVLINKSAEPNKPDRWSKIERISKTFSIAAIPVVLAIGGWFVQRQIGNQSVSKDYVALAVSILREPDNQKVSPELRKWAVELLNDNSPTRFNPAVADQLKSGDTVLPRAEGTFNYSDNGATKVVEKDAIINSATGRRKEALQLAFELQKKNIPFNMGGRTPEQGFNSSTFIAYVLSNVGLDTNPETYNSTLLQQKFAMKSLVSEEEMLKDIEPGDLIFYTQGACMFYLGENACVGMIPGGLHVRSIHFGEKIIGYGKVNY
jgi:cell wall-associated NlpC family hydrolase